MVLRHPVHSKAFSAFSCSGMPCACFIPSMSPVSYTHLDVYKRQPLVPARTFHHAYAPHSLIPAQFSLSNCRYTPAEMCIRDRAITCAVCRTPSCSVRSLSNCSNRSDLVTFITSFRATIIHECGTEVNIAI